MAEVSMYQVSTLQALSLGYSRAVIDAAELLRHGDTGLGTFEDVDGEMIVIDGRCYKAAPDGSVQEAEPDKGVPFAAVAQFRPEREVSLGAIRDAAALKERLTLLIEENFALNSMHMVRIDGMFGHISARAAAPYRSQHVPLRDVLDVTQKNFVFEEIRGSLVCVYFPDYMDGINASGWHFHFISEDRSCGGHVFALSMHEGTAGLCRIMRIEIRIPSDPAFDTYSLKEASRAEIKKVEQGE